MPFKRYARPAAYLILAAVTVYGVYRFATGDPAAVMDYWKGMLPILPVIVLLACLDVALEGVGWVWIYSRLGIRAWDRAGAGAFLAGRAGMLLPAQLGRLLRPDAMVRLRRGTMAECLRAEGVAFVLDATSVVALLAALAAATVLHPLAAPLAALVVIGGVLFLGNRAARFLAGTRLALPQTFWWSWKTVAIIMVEMAGWATHGAAMYLVIRGLPGSATLPDTIFYAAGSSVVGAGTGLPGGIGATEGLLGVSLSVMNVPAAHLALAIAAFRVLTFWIWIPIGWLTLIWLRGRTRRFEESLPQPEVHAVTPPLVVEVVKGIETPVGGAAR